MENQIPKNICQGCARRDELLIQFANANDDQRKEIERLEREIKTNTAQRLGIGQTARHLC